MKKIIRDSEPTKAPELQFSQMISRGKGRPKITTRQKRWKNISRGKGQKETKRLAHLVGSGILYIKKILKDQPLCLVDWTSRDFSRFASADV